VTQNVYSGSTADEKRRSDEHQDSDDIRADIDQTRQSVGNKIDELQARLDPNKLKQQAAESVQEMLEDTANSMTEYVRSHREDITTSLADAARRNPMPAALVGVGIGWLILESFSGGKSSRREMRPEERWEQDRRTYLSRSGRSYEGQFEGGYQRGDRGSSPRMYEGSSFSQGNEYAAEDYSTYREPNYSSTTNFQSGYDYGQAGQYQQRSSSSGSNPIAKAAETVKDTVGDVSSEIKERASDIGKGIKERVGDVKERVTDTVQGVRQQAGDMSNQTQQRMQHSMERTSGSMHRAGEQMGEWQNRARYQGRRRSQQMIRNLEDNPMTYGLVALAAGAALAILLPQTRTENRAFGEMRDQVMDRGQEALETAKTHAQQVANEIRPELEETARKLASDVKEAGKEVVQSAQSEIKPLVDKAVSKGKEETRTAAQELGVDISKISGDNSKSPQVNKDTLKGNWNQMKGEVKRKWGQITDDEMTQIEGDYDKLIGMLQSRYGYARGRAEQEVNDFMSTRKV
jgi:uncharacterized protein YjbJ (UPF0337 family)